MRFTLLIILTILISNETLAEGACGNAPIVSNDSTRITIYNRAQNATNHINLSDFSAVISSDKSDIFAQYPDDERHIAYYQYIVCSIIVSDKNLSSFQKIEQINRAFEQSPYHNENKYKSYWFLVRNKYGEKEEIVRSTLLNTGEYWLEIQKNKIEFTFTEKQTNNRYIWIIDESRGLEIKIPLKGGPSLIRFTGHEWQLWNTIHPSI